MNKNIFPHTTLQAIFVVLLIFIYSTPLVSLEKRFLGNDVVSKELVITLISSLALIATIITVYLIDYKKKIKLSFNFNLINFFLPFISIIIILFQIGLAKPFVNMTNPIFHINLTPKNPFQSISMLFGTLFFAPILEEIIFRGIILKGLLTNYSPKKAILISSLIFGLLHIGVHFLPALITGLFLGWVYYKTESLGNTILLHFIANMAALTGGYLNYKFGGEGITNIYGEWSIYIILGSIALMSVLLFRLFTYVKANGMIKINDD